MKVAICDDKVEIQGEVEKIVKDWYEHNCVWGQVYKCSNRKELLQDIFDLVFLDIQLEKEDGIEIKDYMMKNMEETKIVFITSHQDRMPEAFGRNVLGFINKPIQYPRIQAYLAQTLEYKKKDFLLIRKKNGVHAVDIDRVTYIEAVEKYSYIHLLDDSKIFTDKSLAVWEGELPKNLYVRCHKSYIVCLKNIRNIEKEKIYLSNGDTIQISRRKKQDTIVRYNEFVIRNAK